uniref:Uncharacterized protein n=1 Tax=Timema poppense TaxID=170557 RepID=A0A7R9DBC8_TIMPO|nr:unnamed protein product [Timema poppensis]
MFVSGDYLYLHELSRQTPVPNSSMGSNAHFLIVVILSHVGKGVRFVSFTGGWKIGSRIPPSEFRRNIALGGSSTCNQGVRGRGLSRPEVTADRTTGGGGMAPNSGAGGALEAAHHWGVAPSSQAPPHSTIRRFFHKLRHAISCNGTRYLAVTAVIIIIIRRGETASQPPYAGRAVTMEASIRESSLSSRID